MSSCIAEDDLFELANGGTLGDAPVLEGHLADCAACSALLATLLAAPGDPRDLAGKTLGPYRLDGVIGAGAMGEVYRGWDLRLHRHVAIKVLSREVAGSPERTRRLVAEARAAAGIAHPNVVTIYDTGTEDGIPFIVSELITGESLRSLIARSLPAGIARRTALELGLQLARGLAAAHAQGVVHRDLKPSNLIVTTDGTLKILDFGLAKVLGQADGDATEPGTLLGTVGYLSPEQARGEPADARSDVFAVGAILYELVGGRRAFDGATFADRLSAVLRDDPAPLADPASAIILRCLDKDPAQRFQSAHDLAWVLDGMLHERAPVVAKPPRTVSRRAFLVGAAATGAAGVLLGRVLSSRPQPRVLAPAYRQLTFRHGRVATARFTRDAGSVLYTAAWEGHPLAIYVARLGAGGTRQLALPAAQLLDVSPQGELAISIGHRSGEGFHEAGELAVMPLEGGTPRRLGVVAQHADFAPDGQLAIVRRIGARYALELPLGHVILEGAWISHPRVSPDGKRIACLVHDTPHDDHGELVVIPRHGGDPTTLARGWSSADGVAWSPSGDAIWISASRAGGNNSLWSIALDGRELAHVPTAGRLRLNDVAADGRMAISHVSGSLRMRAKAPGAARELDLALADVTLVNDLSGDGRTIVFTELGDVDSANGAYVRSTDGGEPLRLGDIIPYDLADDGRGLLAGVGAPLGLAIVPLSGQLRVVPTAGIAVRSARWLAGPQILVGGAAAGRPFRLWRLDRGTPTPLTDEGVFGPTAVSSDGRRIALIADGKLLVIEDGVRQVPGVYADEIVCGWHADNRDVFVRKLAAPIAIRRVDTSTGSATAVVEIAPPELGLRRVASVAIDRAGDAYAYSYAQELSRLHVMSLEHGE
jgi:hypothetical protein